MEQPSSHHPQHGHDDQQLPAHSEPATLSAGAARDHSHTDYPVSQEHPTERATAETASEDTSSKAKHDTTTNQHAPNSEEYPQAATEPIAASRQLL